MGGETALAMQGFGVGASTVGAFYGAQAQKSSLQTQAHISEVNANISEMGAQAALLSGQREEQASRLTTAKLKSSQRTALAANGVDLSSQTPVNILTSTDVVGEVDAATIAANASRAAFGYRVQGMNSSNDALIKRATAKGISPVFSATSTLLNGAGTVASSWYQLNKAGAFSKTVSSDYGPQNDVFARNFGQHNLVSDALF